MRERGIPFSPVMVTAVREGRKSMTRRLLEIQVLPPVERWELVDGLWHPRAKTPEVERQFCTTWPAPVRSPYGLPGDLLWVREAWRTGKSLDALSGAEIAKRARAAGYQEAWAPVRYEEDKSVVNGDVLGNFGGEWGRYRHARFMPRWAARLRLEVTEVWVERLQEIAANTDEIHAEGIPAPGNGDLVEQFVALWDSLNGKRAPWGSNPWVWVYGFREVPA